jgi:hypothetical protein
MAESFYGIVGFVVFFLIPVAAVRLLYLRIRKRPYTKPGGRLWLAMIFMGVIMTSIRKSGSFIGTLLLKIGLIPSDSDAIAKAAGTIGFFSVILGLALVYIAAGLWLKLFGFVKMKVLSCTKE